SLGGCLVGLFAIARGLRGSFRVPQVIGVELVEETSARTVLGTELLHGLPLATLGDVLPGQCVALPLGAHAHIAANRVEQPYRVAFEPLGAVAVHVCDLSRLQSRGRARHGDSQIVTRCLGTITHSGLALVTVGDAPRELAQTPGETVRARFTRRRTLACSMSRHRTPHGEVE